MYGSRPICVHLRFCCCRIRVHPRSSAAKSPWPIPDAAPSPVRSSPAARHRRRETFVLVVTVRPA
jgi:hypothetical protein